MLWGFLVAANLRALLCEWKRTAASEPIVIDSGCDVKTLVVQSPQRSAGVGECRGQFARRRVIVCFDCPACPVLCAITSILYISISMFRQLCFNKNYGMPFTTV